MFWKQRRSVWASWIEVSDEDSASFLQSQFSNDLRGGTGRATPGLWLDHRGRIVGESTVLQLEAEHFILASRSSEAATVLLPKLEAHVVADEVHFEDRSRKVTGLQLVSDGDEPLPPAADAYKPEPGRFVQLGAVIAFWGRSGFKRTLEFAGPEAEVAALAEALASESVPVLDASEAAFRRIRAGIPRIPAEIGPGETPAEAGLSALCSLSKGCYLGQEIVNRQERLGRANRVLAVVRLSDDELPALPCELFAGGQVAGELRAAVSGPETRGLAMLKRRHLGAPLSTSPEGAPNVFVSPHE